MKLFVRQSLPSTKAQLSANRQPLILLHGLFGMSDNLKQLAQRLSAHFHVLNIDLPGHGGSRDCGFSDIPTMAKWLEDYILDHNLESVYLVGHSLGGKIAMQLANDCAARVAALVVADIAPVNYAPAHAQIFQALQDLDLKSLQTRQAANTFFTAKIEPLAVRQFILKSLVRNSQQEWMWRFHLENLQYSYAQLCLAPKLHQRFTRPALFLKGEFSDYINAENKNAITAQYPQAQIQTIERAGHWLHVEQADDFYNKLLEFLLAVRNA